LSRYGLEAEVIPQQFQSEELARALKERVAGQRVLLARADRGRDILREELARVASVEQIAVYSQTDIADVDARALGLLRRGEIDHVTVTSSSIARALARVLDDSCRRHVAAGRVKLVSISPVTSAVLKEEGLPVAREATAYTMAGMVDALMALAREPVG
jgi:uroporphyrinogen III methyltransferase/synthase